LAFHFFDDEGKPVGAVEIKVPGKSGVNNEQFAGQLYDYLRILRDIFGKLFLYPLDSLFNSTLFLFSFVKASTALMESCQPTTNGDSAG